MIAEAGTRRVDLLRWPFVGRFVRWRYARLALQVPLFIAAVLIVFDGLVGPQLAPKNLATVGTWLHYRGLVVLGLLLAGNLFCMACPFMLPRRAGRWVREHLMRGGRQLPLALRSKWLAIALVVLFFFAYELFALWSTPWWTAWIAVAYFAVAFAVDTAFQGAAFCKHICALGQFNFFGSLVSPLEIRVREPSACAACPTKDCITAGPRGSQVAALAVPGILSPILSEVEGGAERSRRMPQRGDAFPVDRPGARGCELGLFQPRKAGNMDCTFCLDCVYACPYDNVSLGARKPSSELWSDPFRSGIGRFSRRWDLVALVVVFTFGAFLNAFAMIRPVYALQEALARALDTTSRVPGLVALFVFGLLALPAALLTFAGMFTRRAETRRSGNSQAQPQSRHPELHPERSRRRNAADSKDAGALGPVIARYTFSLVPMGFGMWLAHYAFHFLTGALTIVPVIQSFLADIGAYRGEVSWVLGPLVPAAWLFPIEAVLLYVGAFGSIVTAFRIAQERAQAAALAAGRRRANPERVLAASAPWILLTLLMLAFGLWIMLQPMEMRGTLMIVSGS